MEPTARLCICARCRATFVICSTCDRGQRYCGSSCARAARRASVRAAGDRYQRSRRGRFTHARRQRRYRARQQEVTHQGSPPEAAGDVLPAGLAVSVSEPLAVTKPAVSIAPATPSTTYHCRFCGCRCSPFLRTGFLRTRQAPHSVQLERRGAVLGDFP